MKISIVIPTYNHCNDLLKPCLEAIQKYTDLSDTEVIVVANGCTDDTQEYLKSLPSAFKPIWITEKVGYTKATNAGIKASTGDFIVLLNNDVFLLPQGINLWIDKLRSPFQDPQVGLVGVHKMQNDETKSSFYCFYCVMIKREVFDKVGLLDEIFSPGFGEDIDYCKRMQIAGYKLADGHTGSIMQNNLMVGDFPIHHPGSQSFHDDEHREKYEKIVQRNLLLLRNRYAGEKIKLNLGSGDSHIEGFLGIDLYDDRADLKADMTKLPFANESVEEIIAYHCLEHVTPYDINEVLEECNRVLIPGGKIAVEMPDLIEICKDFPLVPKEQKYVLINEMYGYGEHTGQHHYFGWYDEILMDHLFSHGFDNCVRTEPLTHINAIDKSYCMRIEASKKVNNPKYSIIIPTYNHLEDCLQPCIESISNNTNLKEVEVLVVANGCTNDTRTYVESLGDPFKLIWINEQVGFIKAVNKGMQISRGKYVVILNNDAFVIDPRWMHLLEQPFLNNQKAGISGPMKINSVFAKIKYMMFFCAMIKREVIETVGLLDERYGLGVMDDQDYCLRAIKAGYDVVQVPDEQLRKDATQRWSLGTFPIIHQSKSTFQQIFEKDKMHIKRNMHTFLDIHYPDEVVNIIIPTYNQHSLLKEALTSISNQTYPYIRVWVVSDDSAIENIVDEYNQSNEHVLFTFKNGLPNNLWLAPLVESFAGRGCICFLHNTIPINCVEQLYNNGNLIPVSSITINENTFKDIFIQNNYQAYAKELENKTIIDIGADVGAFSLYGIINGAKKCYCFEPNATNYQKLLQNTAALSQIVASNMAVTRPGLKQAHTIFEEELCEVHQNGNGPEVTCVSLEEILSRITDNDLVLKIDCEGSEYDILLPCPLESLRRFKYIYAEFHNDINENPEYNLDMLEKFIKNAGFKSEYGGFLGMWYFGNDGTPIFCGNNSRKTIKFIRTEETETGESNKEKKPKVYDCFSFFNELDLLELRLNELDEVVDYFVISEATQTHSGKPKPLYFQENKERFSKFLHKIKHIIVEFPETEDSWDRERYQRDQIINVLRQCDDKDIIILSDIDEIVSAEAVKKYNIEMGICVPKMRLFYYFINCQANGDWAKARILPFKAIGQSTLSEFRGWRAPQSLWNTPDGGTIIKREQEIDHFIENGGWHFSFLGNPDSISYKIDSYVHHVEFNKTYNNKENIENSINSGSDVFGRNWIKFKFVKIDHTYPRHVLENLEDWRKKGLISSKADSPKVYDCFLFFNELDLLELRLNELDEVVDYFVISEATKTHSGKPKPLYFQENKERFSKFLHKIKHIIVEFPDEIGLSDISFPFREKNPALFRERFQRHQMLNALRDCKENDVIILSDIDEIVSAGAVRRYKPEMGIYALKMKIFYYFLDCQLCNDWVKSRIFPYSEIGQSTLDEFRTERDNDTNGILENGGWHFSFLGNAKDISYKIDSYSHQELNNSTYNNEQNILSAMKAGTDVFERNIDFSFIRIDETYPRYILENFDSLAAKGLISPNHNDTFLKYLEDQDENYQHLTFHSIFEWNCYGVLPEELKNKIVLDIGGNKGWFSIFSILNGAEKCYCFEPNKITYQHLLKNIVTFKNIMPFNLAVTKPGLEQARTILEGVHCQINEGSTGELVNCISIEKFLEQIPENNDLILKLDCEGSEYDIMFTCSLQSLRRFKLIYAEVHNGMNHNKNYNYNIFEKFMNDSGFKSEEVTLSTPPDLALGIWYNDEHGVPSVFVPSENVENPGSKMLKFMRIEQ